MASTSSNATKFQQARIASKLVAATNANVPCTDCADKAEVQAVILFPSLGTPYVAPADEKTIRLYLLVEDKSVGESHSNMCSPDDNLFGVNEKGEPTLAWYFINRHLRLTPFSESSKTSAKIKGNGLYSSDAVAQKAIKVWYHGRHGSGTPNSNTWNNVLRDHDGNIVATMRSSAINFFVKAQASYGPIVPAHRLDPKEADTSNQPLSHLFEVELSTIGLKVPPQPDRAYSIAWFVTCVYAKAKNSKTGKPVLAGVTHWEHQDKLIYDFLAMMQEKKQHFTTPFTFDVPAIQQAALSKQETPDEGKRIKSYHPVIFKSSQSLRIGHLSDVHVNSRHFALAASQAEVIPKHSEPIGPKLANCFVALRELFDTLRAKGADALFITGDLIDFNHNFNPLKLKKGPPKEQWGQFDLSKQFANRKPIDGGLYPRGLDDILVYSLVKYSYMHDCPVFLTTGNHEAYDMPYAISPRGDRAAFVASAYNETMELRRLQRERETAAAKLDAEGKHEEAKAKREERAPGEAVAPQRVLDIAEKDPATKLDTAARSVSDTATATRNALPKWMGGRSGKSDTEQWIDAKKAAFDEEAKKAYAYGSFRMNEGIPADHNLTIYEACLAFGPAYGQLINAWDFVPDNFDWFFMLFTPLNNFAANYGKAQCLIGLDWGATEIMINADMSGQEAKTSWSAGESAPKATNQNDNVLKRAYNKQLAGASAAIQNLKGLPRADKSIDEYQQLLIEKALARGAKKNLLFSHFTLVNYDMPVSYQANTRSFALNDNTFNDYTKGTFTQRRNWLLGKVVNDGLHYALSGHSHRAGIYSMHNRNPESASVRAYEPALPGDDTAQQVHQAYFPSPQATRIIVSSCGGPIGVQNLRGELYGWNLRAPSGTLINSEADGLDECRRIEVDPAKAPFTQPRFCVALDYLVIDKKLTVVSFNPDARQAGKFTMLTAHVQEATHYIEKAEFFAWVTGGRGGGSFKSFSTTLTPAGSTKNNEGPIALIYTLTIDDWTGLLKTQPTTAQKKADTAPCFIRLHFNQALATHPLYKHYSFDDSWIFPVTISATGISRAQGALGEVPNFKWLRIAMRDTYFYDTGPD